jgi:hypothetical protein
LPGIAVVFDGYGVMCREVDYSPAHAGFMARFGGTVREEWSLQRLLVHVLADWCALSQTLT